MFTSPLSKLFLLFFSLLTVSTMHRIVNRSHPIVPPKPTVCTPILTKKDILHSAFGINSFVSAPYPNVMHKNDTYEFVKRRMLLG